MAQLFTRYLEILKRWPVDEARTIYCFGKYLRNSSPKWFSADGKPIGKFDDCERRLISLERLADDYYKRKYSIPKIYSVTGMTVEQCTKTLNEDFGEQQGFIQKVISKFSFRSSKQK